MVYNVTCIASGGHSVQWEQRSLRHPLYQNRSRNCPTVFPRSIQIQYHCGAILRLEELWSRSTNSSHWVTHKNWIHSPRGSCWSLEAAPNLKGDKEVTSLGHLRDCCGSIMRCWVWPHEGQCISWIWWQNIKDEKCVLLSISSKFFHTHWFKASYSTLTI